jgi:hypothetical protein
MSTSAHVKLDGDLRENLAAIYCGRCDSVGGYALIGRDWPHFGRVICGGSTAALIDAINRGADEGHYLDWLSAPKDNAPTRRRTRMRPVDALVERCEICLRHARELAKPNRLQAHHALEVVAHGGDDDDANRRVYCDDCHRLVHWVRRTLGRDHAV